MRLVVDTDDWEGPGGWNTLGNYTPAQRLIFTWQERWGLTHADVVTVASQALQTITWSLGVIPDRVFYIPNGIVRRCFFPGEEEAALPGFVGGFNADKTKNLKRVRNKPGIYPLELSSTMLPLKDHQTDVTMITGLIPSCPVARLTLSDQRSASRYASPTSPATATISSMLPAMDRGVPSLPATPSALNSAAKLRSEDPRMCRLERHVTRRRRTGDHFECRLPA